VTAVWPIDEQEYPAGQFEQLVAPMFAWKYPSEHFVQEKLADEAAYIPAKHSEHAESPALE